MTFKRPEDFKKYACLLTNAVREGFKALGMDLAGNHNKYVQCMNHRNSNMSCLAQHIQYDAAVVRPLTSHQCGPGSNPCRVDVILN